MLLRCGDGDGEGGEGGARLGVGCPRLVSPALEVDGTAGVAEAEEVGRFWKYCSPGSSSSRLPHGNTCTQHATLLQLCPSVVVIRKSRKGKIASVYSDPNTDTPVPAQVRGVCSPLARLLAWRLESHRGEAGLTAASGAGWQSLVETNE